MQLQTISIFLSILLTVPAHAAGKGSGTGSFFGFGFGVGSLDIAENFFKEVGNGLTSTRDGLVSGDSVIRDATHPTAVWTLAANAGYQWGFIGVGGRARTLVNIGGHGQHYFRGDAAIIGVEETDFDYYASGLDLGPKICVTYFCVRPYVGAIMHAVQKFNFGAGNKFQISRDEGSKRLAYGLAATVVIGPAPGDGIELGVDFSRYRSQLGGTTTMILVTIGGLITFGN